MKIYGIPNCNTVKKALTFLDDAGIDYEFVNFKKNPPTKTLLKEWKNALGEYPVNKRGPTFRKIKEDFEDGNDSQRLTLLIENSSAIKRPIIIKGKKLVTLGFSEEEYEKLFN